MALKLDFCKILHQILLVEKIWGHVTQNQNQLLLQTYLSFFYTLDIYLAGTTPLLLYCAVIPACDTCCINQ